MPTYEYQCQKCGKTFEQFQSMKDAPLTECPESVCPEPEWGRGQVKRLPGTGAGLIFKGSGFYITDYRSESYKQAAKSESGAPSGGGAAPASGGSAPASGSGTASSSGASGGGSGGSSGSGASSGSGTTKAP